MSNRKCSSHCYTLLEVLLIILIATFPKICTISKGPRAKYLNLTQFKFTRFINHIFDSFTVFVDEAKYDLCEKENMISAT